jgi:ketosteroid isomerase-like protein
VTPGQLVRTLYERYQARNWSDAALLLHEDSTVLMPATNEQLIGRDQVIGMQRDYPEPWGDLQVLRVIGDERSAVAELEVVAPITVFRCAAFWDVHDGLLHRGVEYWVTVGGEETPPDRRRYDS